MGLAELFYAKQIFRRTPPCLPRPRRTAPRRFTSPVVNRKSQFLMEPLEPRLLLAADTLLLAPLAPDPAPRPSPPPWW